LLSKSADFWTQPSVAISAAEPAAELGNVGQIIAGLVARHDQRDARGRFTLDNTGHMKGLDHSEQLREALEPLKRDLVQRVRLQLGADVDDAPETLLGMIDGYAEARLLRSSAFVRLAQLGGFVTSKGKARALLTTWGSAFDREMRAAERLGLVRRARRTQSPREWLESLEPKTREEDLHEDAPISDETGRPREIDQRDDESETDE
jgi:hypothetical protein